MFIEFGVINAHSPFIILFSYKDRIGEPIGVIHFFIELGCKNLCDLCPNSLLFVTSEPSYLLLDRSCGLQDV